MIKSSKYNKAVKKNNIKSLIIVPILIFVIGTIYNKTIENKQIKKVSQHESNKYYEGYIITQNEINIYKERKNIYQKVGIIAKNQELKLIRQKITDNTKYLKINLFNDEYYVYYKDIKFIEKPSQTNNRYKKYIVFNKNIITKNLTNFYDDKGSLVYNIKRAFNLPVIINKKDEYGVEVNNRLLYVKKEDVYTVKQNNNSKEIPTTKIKILAYHRIYDSKTEECNQVICHTEEQFESHIKYLSDNDYLTLTTNELSDYIDGYIQIPKKSTVITIDDGTMVKRGIDIIDKYRLNAILFIVTSRFKESDYLNNFYSEYVELHSHSHNMHWAGECAGYGTQGGGILCLPVEKILEDLKTSSKILNNSTIFCYPFYDYNDRAINLLKEAGYTMAFAGLLNTNGYTYVGTNKMLIPRETILSNTTFEEFKSYITY